MAWLEKFKGPKYPSTTAPQDATRTNYTPTFQNPTNANVRKINFANSPEQYEIDSNTGQTTGRGGLEDATLDAMMALDLPLALGKAAARGIVKNVIPNISKITPWKFKPASSFNSEINWAKWNKEIPKNSQLMKEYNAIEQTSKANGTWMKNPDGSTFQGTPEQFVQQNSENFKKAFGNSKLINPDGSPTIQYHGSPRKFDTFNESQFGTGNDDGFYGKGIYASPDRYVAKSYSYENMFAPNSKQGEIYELYVNSKNPGYVYKNNERVMPTGMARDFNRGINNDIDKFNYDLLDVKKPGNHHEVVIPFTNYPKSAIGNNGMFDMTNPNIYKAMVPAGVIGAGAMQQKAEGGVVSNLRSQLNLKPKEKATSDHVMQLYENLNLGNFNKEVSDYLTSINDEEELLTHLNKFDEGGIQGRPLISQRPPQFMANQVPLYSTDNNTEVAPDMAPSRLPDPTVEMVEPTIAAPIPTVPSAKPVKQPLLNTTSGTHIATPSAVDKRTLPKPVKPILNSARKVEDRIESTPVKPLQKSTVTNITKSTSKLPSDALQVLEEKSKNPAWASFKGKYSIYSKENSTLYLFDNNHKLVDQIVAGRGMTKGDFPNTADAHKSAKSNKLKATTPAGSYAIWEERKNSPKSGYGNKTYLYGQPNEVGTATALHDAWGKGNDDEEYERRMAILNDPKIKQKLFSYGCINIPTGWLDKNDANINVGDSVFITPEPMQINLLGKR